MLRWIKNKYHLIRSFFAAVYFRFPSKRIKVIGVTGTNGKTTTIQMIGRILEEDGHRIAMASTINFKFAQKEWVNETKFTTLSAWEVQKFIQRAVDERCEYLVLEVSSHALDQSRLAGVYFDIAVITNVTREHLDYHNSMDRYRSAKAKLFKKLKKNALGVINLDMEDPQRFIKITQKRKHRVVAFTTDGDKNEVSKKDGTLMTVLGEQITSSIRGSYFTIRGERFHLNIPGIFNIENALAAICVGSLEGARLSVSKRALENTDQSPVH